MKLDYKNRKLLSSEVQDQKEIEFAVLIRQVLEKSVAGPVSAFQKRERKHETFVFAVFGRRSVNRFAVYEHYIAAFGNKIIIVEGDRKFAFHNADNLHARVPVESHFVFRMAFIDYIYAERKILRSVLFQFIKTHNFLLFA